MDNSSCPDSFPPFQTTYAKEFRYDSTRKRYLSRDLNTNTLLSQSPDVATWSDYEGSSVYGDHTISSGVATDTASYEPGTAKVEPWTSFSASNTDYYHSDHVGTTRMMTGDLGVKKEEAVYTAFGERVSGASRRYGYAGAYGYQTHDEFAYQHLGARYYNPSSGRFLQRDPIGILGGLNVYAYVGNNPVVGIDPSGKVSFGIGINFGVHLGFFNLQFEISYHWGKATSGDGHTSSGLSVTLGGGIGLGLGASASVIGTVTSVEDVSELAGDVYEVGGDIGPIGGAIIYGPPSNQEGTAMGGIQGSLGFGFGGGVRAGGTHTGMFCLTCNPTGPFK